MEIFERTKSTVDSYKAGLSEQKCFLVQSMNLNLEVRQKNVSNVSITHDLPLQGGKQSTLTTLIRWL